MALAEVFERVAGPDAPVDFRAYDGSKAGSGGAPVRITVKSPTAVAYLAQAPGALGLARAYVSGSPGRGRRHVRGAEPDGQRPAPGDRR